MKVRITGLPRAGDPEAQRKLFIGMELDTVEPDPDEPMEQISDKYYWVSYEQVVAQMTPKDPDYANFFRHMRATPGGSQAPGLLFERNVCEVIN